MSTSKKYLSLLIKAIESAGGSVQKVGTGGLKIKGPSGICFMGTRDRRTNSAVAHIHKRTGLTITF